MEQAMSSSLPFTLVNIDTALIAGSRSDYSHELQFADELVKRAFQPELQGFVCHDEGHWFAWRRCTGTAWKRVDSVPRYTGEIADFALSDVLRDLLTNRVGQHAVLAVLRQATRDLT
jgi:hypothetical protein